MLYQFCIRIRLCLQDPKKDTRHAQPRVQSAQSAAQTAAAQSTPSKRDASAN